MKIRRSQAELNERATVAMTEAVSAKIPLAVYLSAVASRS